MQKHRRRSSTVFARAMMLILLPTLLGVTRLTPASAEPMVRLQYNHPGLVVDLGVGLWAWPLPMDWDRDGDLDLIVSCPDVPFNGTYLFENPGGNPKAPVFRAPVRLGGAQKNVRLSYIDGRPRVLTPGKEWTDFVGVGFSNSRKIQVAKIEIGNGRIRANQWHYLDYDGDGARDVCIGVGYWGDYGWDNAFNDQGQWTRGPLHGYVYLARNRGTTASPNYETPVEIEAGGEPVDVYGMPSPCFADFDGDGDLDLICGEFLDGFTYFRNIGSRTRPRYVPGQRLRHQGHALAMNLQMITPTAIDWDGDGDVDLIVGDEDGRVALVEHTGQLRDGAPAFLPPLYFQQEARDVKFGALVTPVSVDWDSDGDEDLICGNTAGHIAFIENLDGGNPPKWARPKLLEADGRTLRLQAGVNGSIQGPCEAKWGYTTLSVADWDHDGRLDLLVNSIWGKIVWYRNVGTKSKPKLAGSQPVTVEWQGDPPKPAWNWWRPEAKELATQWRTTPCVVDWDRDGLNDLVMLDHEGYLAFFGRQHRNGRLVLLPGQRLFQGGVYDSKHRVKCEGLLRLNNGSAGGSGRRKLCIVDWDGDGRRDLLVNSTNVSVLRQVSADGPPWRFEDVGGVSDHKLAGHTTSPTTVDWDGDGVRDLLVGAEDGRLYYLRNPRRSKTAK
jgi:FG-GAP-like repeat